ncbi:MAG: prepilin-type N-terminal cleavage/methylation domain-containing protein [Planctomycetia bacterium]|nr:prepilin-type N-terminal cleavage/methylation domain-containing protein [Planctomycetia bacterium]
MKMMIQKKLTGDRRPEAETLRVRAAARVSPNHPRVACPDNQAARTVIGIVPGVYPDASGCLTSRRSGVTPVSHLPTPDSRAAARAFTLVELMAVMTIMLIMAVITIPAFAKMFQNSNQVAAMNEIAAMISQGRALALKMHQQVAVVFYEENATNVPTPSSGTKVVFSGETAIALAIAPQGQPENGSSTSTPLYFEPYLAAPVQYLPKGMVVAALTSTTAGVSGLNTASTCRAIVFDAAGHLVLRSYLGAMPNPDNPTGADYLDWQFISTINASPAVIPTSSPGVLAYEPSALPNPLPSPYVGNLAGYLAANNDVFIVNSYTGNVVR